MRKLLHTPTYMCVCVCVHTVNETASLQAAQHVDALCAPAGSAKCPSQLNVCTHVRLACQAITPRHAQPGYKQGKDKRNLRKSKGARYAALSQSLYIYIYLPNHKVTRVPRGGCQSAAGSRAEALRWQTWAREAFRRRTKRLPAYTRGRPARAQLLQAEEELQQDLHFPHLTLALDISWAEHETVCCRSEADQRPYGLLRRRPPPGVTGPSSKAEWRRTRPLLLQCLGAWGQMWSRKWQTTRARSPHSCRTWWQQ